jgi:hypothetical protein
MDEIMPAKETKIIQPKEPEPVIIRRGEFINTCFGAIDALVVQRKAVDDGIVSIANMVNRSTVLENDPDVRVEYLRMPNKTVALRAYPKGRFGFPFKNERKKG